MSKGFLLSITLAIFGCTHLRILLFFSLLLSATLGLLFLFFGHHFASSPASATAICADFGIALILVLDAIGLLMLDAVRLLHLDAIGAFVFDTI